MSFLRPLLAFLLLTSLLPAEEGDPFALFESGDIDAAAAIYEKKFAAGERSPELFYNIGNIAFRKGELGEAALWYRRAITAGSGHPESEQNLEVIDQKTGRLVASPSPLQELLALPGTSFWLWAGTILLWIALIAFAATLLYPRPKMAGIALSLFIAIAGLCFILAYNLRLNDVGNKNVAIVTSAASTVHTSPSPTSSVLLTAPAGSETTVLAQRGTWSYVALPGENRGWINSDALTLVALPN